MVRRAQQGEKLTTLDDVERTLDPADLLITDGGTTPLAIAGVMGGRTTELSATTTHVVIEAAHFDPVSVARSCCAAGSTQSALISSVWTSGVIQSILQAG